MDLIRRVAGGLDAGVACFGVAAARVNAMHPVVRFMIGLVMGMLYVLFGLITLLQALTGVFLVLSAIFCMITFSQYAFDPSRKIGPIQKGGALGIAFGLGIVIVALW